MSPIRTRSPKSVPWLAQTWTAVAALLFAFPVYILVNLSLKAPGDSAFPLIPAWRPTLTNYANAWTEAALARAMMNSVIVTVVTTIVVALVASLAAYPLARATSTWSKAAFYSFLLGMILPFQLPMIPLYTTLRDMGLLGTLPGIILFHIGAQIPFAVFMFTVFLRHLDRDFEEAAELDGCGPLRTYWHIVLPLSRPVTATVGILTAIHVWNDFFAPLIFLSGGQETVPMRLYGFVGTYYSEWNLVFAGLIISALPVLVLFFFMQKTVIQGFAGGLKG